MRALPLHYGLILFFSLTACSLQDRVGSKTVDASHQFIRKLEPGTAMVRSNGTVIALRLRSLFPATTSAASLNDVAWTEMGAQGIGSSIAQRGRPTTTIAQVALRQTVSNLCRNSQIGSTTTKSSIFSTTDILLPGEQLPKDATVRKAFAAVRNAWLAPIPESSSEIGILVKLYQDLQSSGSTVTEADTGLCMAVLLSPQFLYGTNLPTEPLKRAALELGHRLPTFAEFGAFTGGQFKLAEFVRKIQAEPGYLNAVKEFHKDWLGLRDITGALRNADPRGNSSLFDGSFSVVGGMKAGVHSTVFPGDPRKLMRSADSAPFPWERCDVTKPDGQANVQPFDPRTKMMLFQVFNPVANRWEVAGAFVHRDAANDLKAYLSYYPNPDEVVAQCVAEDVGPGRKVNAVIAKPQYLRCNGRVAKTAGGFATTLLPDLAYNAISPTDSNKRIFFHTKDANGNPTSVNSLEGTVVQEFVLKGWYSPDNMIRVTRVAPTGEQNGVSVAKSWFTGEEYYVCNSIFRFVSACAYRPPSERQGPTTWSWTADYSAFPDNHWYKTGSWVYEPMSPYPLNEMRCGAPTPELVYSSTIATDHVAYPYGYDLNNYLAPVMPNQNSLNSVMSTITFAGGATKEGEALNRLKEDLSDEPLNLVSYILTQHRPYTELVTARYTIGRAELDFFYRTQGYYLPKHPQGLSVPAPADPDRNRYRVIDFSSMMPLSSSYVTNYPINKATILNNWRVNRTSDKSLLETTSDRAVLPKPAAGILTMPAFVTPAGKARTFADRIFERLMCGLPGSFKVPDGKEAIHEKYMLDPSNPATSKTAAQHLDKKQICYTCHVNLDPLAAALGAGFLKYVQAREDLAFAGEMHNTYEGFGATTYGLNYDTELKGQGAFLGREVSGVQQVGDTLASSDQFVNCATQRAFQFVFGREIGTNDLVDFMIFMQSFKRSNYDYNNLVVEMTTSKLYQGEQ